MHRTNRRAYVISALVAICTTLAFSLAPLHAQALSTDSFYTGTKSGGVNPEPVTAETGVTYALYYTDDSGQTSNYAYVSDTDVNRMDKSVADVDLVRNLRAVIVVTNPTDAPISINARVTTPYGDYAGGGGNDRPVVRLSGPATIETTAPNTELFAKLSADSGSTELVSLGDAAGAYAGANSWADLKTIAAHKLYGESAAARADQPEPRGSLRTRLCPGRALEQLDARGPQHRRQHFPALRRAADREGRRRQDGRPLLRRREVPRSHPPARRRPPLRNVHPRPR